LAIPDEMGKPTIASIRANFQLNKNHLIDGYSQGPL
jgi:hypothetical protein